ncbi:multi-copper polyphenol oxidoreductase laccase domain protein [Leptospira borgpetersenii serovar Pomona str. 200901868]|uniref:Multi-copper polyphenol oxidoreductase laccase domain protein n=1 Tax=Leptospira borgpetersenii serovar Pomona str. 200901868 TaxID=1192866 RepID=M6WH33_LEPBO|nr:multi-copper polyphenol oxidoreductase laccase domain protein [Leptospira borgpetersenii serovar Pomona str. 200901868]
MALFHSFSLSEGKKIKILIAGKKELPSASLDVRTQRKEISRLTEIPESNVYILNQIHGDEIIDLATMGSFSFPKGDAFVGEESDKVLCIKTADCIPLFFGRKKAPSLSRSIPAGKEHYPELRRKPCGSRSMNRSLRMERFLVISDLTRAD